jgi:hypothetical protein
VHEKKLSFILKINYDSWNSNSTRRTQVAAQATGAACFAGSDESLQFFIVGTALCWENAKDLAATKLHLNVQQEPQRA